MELIIKNYKNIDELDLKLDERKINFIYGMSGSGKSSIAGAMNGEIKENVVSYGKNIDDTLVDLNPIVVKDSYSIFDENAQKQLLIERNENNNMYSIIFANSNELGKIKNDISTLLSKINFEREHLLRYINDVENMIKKINTRKFTKSEIFSAASSIEKLKKETENPKYKKYSNFIHDNGLEYVKWIEQGVTFSLYENNKCPFCSRKLTDNKKEKINEILEIKPEQYKIIADSQDVLKDIGITVPNFSYKREIKKLEQDLYEAINNKNIIIDMYNMIDSYSSNMLDINKIEKIKLSNSLKKLFPELEEIIADFNNNIKEIKRKFGNFKAKTAKIVFNNLKKLNNYLNLFSIPYKFSVDNYNISSRSATVFLISTKDEKHKDRTENLSYGEKNLIALLLFLLSNNNEVVVIDDPASSYDDNRRKIIYELLYEFHNNRTFLVLSHDQVFIKYAILGIENKDDKKYRAKTGKIICLENHLGNCVSKEINIDDFGTLDKQVKSFIKKTKMPYYRKIINLRILAEINKNIDEYDKIVYEYLSAILHRKSKNIIANELKEKGFTENDVLKIIYDKYKLNLKRQPNNIFEKFNYDELTNFEKIAFKREEARLSRLTSNKYKKKSYIEKEFDDIVHLNTRYFVSLNPYKFDNLSEYIYQYIFNED